MDHCMDININIIRTCNGKKRYQARLAASCPEKLVGMRWFLSEPCCHMSFLAWFVSPCMMLWKEEDRESLAYNFPFSLFQALKNS